MAQAKAKRKTRDPDVADMLEGVLGCKWSLKVLAMVQQGVNRPGAMTRAAPGLSAKVLNERLRKLCRYGVLERTSFPELPPRVEYALTPFGRRFAQILDQIAALEMERGAIGTARPPAA